MDSRFETIHRTNSEQNLAREDGILVVSGNERIDALPASGPMGTRQNFNRVSLHTITCADSASLTDNFYLASMPKYDFHTMLRIDPR